MQLRSPCFGVFMISYVTRARMEVFESILSGFRGHVRPDGSDNVSTLSFVGRLKCTLEIGSTVLGSREGIP